MIEHTEGLIEGIKAIVDERGLVSKWLKYEVVLRIERDGTVTIDCQSLKEQP